MSSLSLRPAGFGSTSTADDQELAFVPALEVEDYEAAKEFLKSSGCDIVREWPKSKALYFRDPLGQLIDIKETKWM